MAQNGFQHLCISTVILSVVESADLFMLGILLTPSWYYL